MPWDSIENLVGDVLAAPLSDVASEFTPTVSPAAWPDPPFNLVIWPAADDEPTLDNSEYVRVTALNAGTISISRAQEGSTARAFLAGARVEMVPTAKAFTDLQAGIDALDVTAAAAVTAPDTDSLVGIRDSADGWALKKITLFNLRALFKTAYDLAYLAIEPLLIKFGGSTSSFPMLKRNAAIVDVKLADDSAYAALAAGQLAVRDGTANRITLSYVGGQAVQTTVANAGWVFEVNHSAAPPILFKLGDAVSATIERLRITYAGLLTFGGANSTFPALKPNGTTLEVKLADDSAYAPLQASKIGIATAPGTYPLEVAGTIRATGTNNMFLIQGTGGGFVYWLDATPSKAFRFIGNASCDLVLGTYAGTSWVNALYCLNTNGYLGVFNAAPADPLDVTGNVRLSGNLKWGGTSSFPMLKRNAATVDVRLADDSAYAALQCGTFNANGLVSALLGLTVSGGALQFGTNGYFVLPTVTGGPVNESAGELWRESTGGLHYYDSEESGRVALRDWVQTKKVNGGISFNLKGTITTGVKTRLIVPCACTITGWDIIADASCSVVLDIWKGTKASQPTSNASSIAGSEKPTLASGTYADDLSLDTWTPSLSAGDVLVLNVDSVTLGSATEIAVVLRTERTVV